MNHRNPTVLLLSVALLAATLTGCGAVSNQLKQGMADAQAAEEAGWRLDYVMDTADVAARKFLTNKNGGNTPNSTKTSEGPFNTGIKVYDDKSDGSERWAFYFHVPRFKGGSLPDSKSTQLSKVVYQKKMAGELKDVSSHELNAFVDEYIAFLKDFKP
jgi:hypothetical protein